MTGYFPRDFMLIWAIFVRSFEMEHFYFLFLAEMYLKLQPCFHVLNFQHHTKMQLK
jgi:hypothetical protein